MCFNASINIPAVYGDQGSIIHFDIMGKEGNENIFLKIDPIFADNTQESILTAYYLAKNLSNNTNCSYYVITNDSSEYLSGPSGGAAFFLGFYSAMTGKKIRDDALVSGTIEQDGTLGPIGGILEKSSVAKSIGKEYFVTPDLYTGDVLLIENNGIKAVEVNDVQTLINYMFSKKPLPEKKPEHEFIALEQYQQSPSAIDAYITLLLSKNQKMISAIKDKRVKEFFEEENRYNREAFEKGHVLTAGNRAFSNFILLYDMNRMANKTIVEQCLNSLSPPKITYQNYQALSFALQREYRARVQYRYAQSTSDYAYAYAWCLGAKTIYDRIDGLGDKIDEQEYRYLVDDNFGYDFYDEVAENLYADGHYIAAFYELQYNKEQSNYTSKKEPITPLAKIYYYYAKDLEKSNSSEANIWYENAMEIDQLDNIIKEDSSIDYEIILIVLAIMVLPISILLVLINHFKRNN